MPRWVRGHYRARPRNSAKRCCMPTCLRWCARGWPLARPSGWPSCGASLPFLNLLDADPAAADQLEPLQLVLATVQPILQQYEGTLKQVVVDEKGLTLIAVLDCRPWPMRTIRPGDPGRPRGAGGPAGAGRAVRDRAGHRPGVLRRGRQRLRRNTTSSAR